jgi:hypothetical protein
LRDTLVCTYVPHQHAGLASIFPNLNVGAGDARLDRCCQKSMHSVMTGLTKMYACIKIVKIAYARPPHPWRTSDWHSEIGTLDSNLN